ncbi:MAG: acyltransferase [Promethearchaeota archaeon]
MEARLNSIDILRGFAVILMVIGHIYYSFPDKYNKSSIIGPPLLFIVLIAPPFFLIISGFGFYLFIVKRINSGFTKRSIIKDICLRAIFIFIIATLFQFFFGSLLNMQISSIIYWSIFQIIAFSMILFLIIPFLNQKIRIFFYIFSFSLIFFIYFFSSYSEGQFIFKFLVNGIFPFIPWVNFFLFGMGLSDFKLNSSIISQKREMSIILFIGVLVTFLWFFLFVLSFDLFILTFFKAIGLFLIFFSILYFYFDIKELESILSKRIIEWGKLAFSIYYLQFGIAICLKFLFDKKIIQFESLIVLFIQFLILASVILFFLEFFLLLWKKFEYKYGIEWLMNLFSSKSLFIKKDFHDYS